MNGRLARATKMIAAKMRFPVFFMWNPSSHYPTTLGTPRVHGPPRPGTPLPGLPTLEACLEPIGPFTNLELLGFCGPDPP